MTAGGYRAASSGYTLTVVLNAQDNSLAGIASNDKNWMPGHGTFKVSGPAKK